MGHGKIDLEHHLRTIFRRCVECPKETPSCPSCASDEQCSLQQASCTECASTVCLKTASLPGQASISTPTPVGAIAGGTVGGVVAIMLLVYLFYRSCIKHKRRDDGWVSTAEKRNTRSNADAASRRSVGSIASTVLTRASNVIQIAYIPGIINRTPPDSPAHLIPPVPALPFSSATSSPATTPHIDQDMHFFMPGDLRDSTYSGMSEDQRLSMAPSITPSLARASVATTLYGNHAVVSSMPAQQGLVARPAVVSVKSGSTEGVSGDAAYGAPPVPPIPSSVTNNGSSIIARTAMARPIEVKKNAASKMPTMGNLARAASNKQGHASIQSSTAPIFWEEKEVVVSRGGERSGAVSPVVLQKPSFTSLRTGASSPVSTMAGSPLRDVTSSPTNNAEAELNAMISDAMNMAARDPGHFSLAPRPGLRKHASTSSGPFSDSHELKENI